MDLRDVQGRIRRFLTDELGLALAPVALDLELIEDDHLDSMDIVRIAAFLEDLLGLEIPDRDVTNEHFGSLSRMLDYVSARSALDR